MLFVVLATSSLVSGLRLEDDSYQHFARSFHQVSTFDVRAIILDVWNKPVTGLFYGMTGLFGIYAPRLLSVAITVGTAYLTAQLCARFVRAERSAESWAFVVFFAAQMAVLKDAFVTMTEGPAAFFLALGLWLRLVRDKPWVAAIAIGVVPLCRAEMVPITGFVGLWLSVDAWRSRGTSEKVNWRHAFPLLLAGFPFVAWVGAGVLATGDLHWFSRSSYAYLRSWDLPGVLRYNVLSGLPHVLPIPALFLFFVGILRGLGSLRGKQERWQLVLLGGALLIHYVLLNTLVVFPKGWLGLPAGHAVAAANARNYTPTAPIAAVFIGLGVVACLQNRQRLLGVVLAALGLSALAIISGRFGSWGPLALDLSVLIASACGIWFSLHSRKRIAQRHFLSIVASACLIASFLVRPLFWYPTRWNDRRAASVEAMLALVRAEKPARVVQDLASSLEVFGGLEGVDASWTYPHLFPTSLAAARTGAILVLEADSRGNPSGRYPIELVKQLARSLGMGPSEFQLIRRYASPPQQNWLTLLDRVASKNQPVYWLAYRMRKRGHDG